MKILYGITKSNFGGAQRYVFELATEAKRGGHEVIVLCGKGGKLVEKLEKEKIKVIALRDLERDVSLVNDLKSFLEIRGVLKKEKPDIFHINSSKMGGLGAFSGRLVGIRKIIFTAHGWAFNEPRPEWQKVFIKFLTWLTIILSHRTICVSEKTKSDVSGLPFIKNKLVVVYNGIKGFQLSPRGDQVLTIGTIAELHIVKGLDILLMACGKFMKNHKAKLVIFGEGEERVNLQNMAQNLGISGSTEFRGFVDNARSLLSSFDIFCLPSRSEAMPYALLEAGISGLPVIATNVGGISEVIENSLNGILIKPEDAETLFSSLVLLAGDASLRKRLGSSLKASIKERFSLDSMLEKTFKVYL